MDAQQDNTSKEKMQDIVSTDQGHVSDTEISKADAKRLLLKTDLVVMPLAVLSMTLAFLDKVIRRSSIGFIFC